MTIDSIYYPGVLDYIKNSLNFGSPYALALYNCYTTKNGRYEVDFGEGHFIIKNG